MQSRRGWRRFVQAAIGGRHWEPRGFRTQNTSTRLVFCSPPPRIVAGQGLEAAQRLGAT
jgi:hypothetical protein